MALSLSRFLALLDGEHEGPVCHQDLAARLHAGRQGLVRARDLVFDWPRQGPHQENRRHEMVQITGERQTGGDRGGGG